MKKQNDAAKLVGLSWSKIRDEARAFVKAAPPNAYELATKWYSDPAWEVRFFAVIILGGLAGENADALAFLFENCGDDPSWQVNEALAMAFDDYCSAIGYEKALPTLRQWLKSKRPNLRRAVSEGLRPWTASKRQYFAQEPQRAIELLGLLKDDPSRYVQESVGNALRDISRKHPDLVVTTVREWVQAKPSSKPRRVIARFALERAVKEDPSLREIFESF